MFIGMGIDKNTGNKNVSINKKNFKILYIYSPIYLLKGRYYIFTF